MLVGSRCSPLAQGVARKAAVAGARSLGAAVVGPRSRPLVHRRRSASDAVEPSSASAEAVAERLMAEAAAAAVKAEAGVVEKAGPGAGA